mgnify:CR=1 FL=1
MTKFGNTLLQKRILELLQKRPDVMLPRLSGLKLVGHPSRGLRVSRQSEGEGEEELKLRDLAMQSLHGGHKPAFH